jgi:hypothetical protein
MKRFLAIILSTILFVLSLASCSSTNGNTKSTLSGINNSTASTASAKETAKIELGEYLIMGKYYDEPILWRCVDIDENGPLMLADKILTFKAFDAKGSHTYLDGTPQPDPITGGATINGRLNNGSNLWETSNIRSWLNSTATAGNVSWPDGCPPTNEKILGNINGYASEKGFLQDENFSANERVVIKTVTQKSLLNNMDTTKLKIGGTTEHITYNDIGIDISTIVQNYDSVYYHNVNDKMFLLDVKQVNKVYQNGTTLGTNYYIGKPTQKAVDNSEFKDSSITIANNYYCWLRSPASNGHGVRVTSEDSRDLNSGGVGANAGIVGVRPSFYINQSSVMFKSGDGKLSSPYILK